MTINANNSKVLLKTIRLSKDSEVAVLVCALDLNCKGCSLPESHYARMRGKHCSTSFVFSLLSTASTEDFCKNALSSALSAESIAEFLPRDIFDKAGTGFYCQ